MCGTDDCLIKYSSVPCATPENDTKDTSTTINLDHGDPTMYESYWRKMGNKCDITFNGDESLSYFANGKSLCWFLESKLEEQIKRLHNVVGNVIVDDHYIVVGTGSSQLMQAALYALSPTDQLEPISVVSATTFYSHTAIPSIANHNVMLFTISKCTSHASSKIGWALVKDKEVARKMTNFMEISTIGVSKEAQLRAAKILEVVSDSCLDPKMENFFEYSQSLMTDKWQRLRQVVLANNFFVLQKGGDKEDCEKLLKEHTIHTRSGRRFGSDSRNVRISMLSRDEDFNIFLKRLMAIQGSTNRN
ncbi:hypothetical protein KY284_005279 [Solanum tuberosum]|nr:hypothetical protein KY284_005279 [Solanum tuberosum]